MASLTRQANGTYVIQISAGGGRRHSIRLGKVSKRNAESVRTKVEHLAAAKASRLPLDIETANWVAGVGEELAARLAAAGLVPRRQSSELGEFLEGYVARRRADSKGTTAENVRRACLDLADQFGAGTPVRTVTPAMADDLAAHYAARGLAGATAARRLKVCRMVFDHAVRHELCEANPFAGVKGPPAGPNQARKCYVPRETVFRVIGGCSPDWQLIAALSRFAGLRAPSEVLLLRRADIDLAKGEMLVHSPKTEHHPNGASRRVPIFPDLRPFLERGVERSAGMEHVVNGVGERGRARMLASPIGWTAVNLSVPFGKMVVRAGFALWPKVMHNMRASCQTDLTAHFPAHVVCKWLGNSLRVAETHYLTTQEDDFRRAARMAPTPFPAAGSTGAEGGAVVVQNAVRTGAATDGQAGTVERLNATIPSDLAPGGRPCPPLSEYSNARDRT